MRKITFLIVASTAVVQWTPLAHAAGYQLFEQSVSGLGRAYAGDGAIVDNSSAITYNPALASAFKDTEFSAGLTGIFPSIKTTQKTKGSFTGYKMDDTAPEQYVPNLSFVHPFSERWSGGVSLFSNYGESTNYKKGNTLTDLLGGETILRSVTLNPSLSYKIDDKFSVGFGVDIAKANAKLERRLDVALGAAKGYDGDAAFTMRGEDWGYGYNFGIAYQPNPDNRWGISYRSEVKFTLTGDFDQTAKGSNPSSFSTSGKLDLSLPAMATFAGMTKIDPNWMISYGITWTQWSKFKELKATGPNCASSAFSQHGACFYKNEDFHDNMRYSIGSTWKVSPSWSLRSGFALDKQAGKTTLSLPDTDRYWLSAGATWQATQKLSVDMGLTWMLGASSSYDEYVNGVGHIDYKTKSQVILAGAQINYRL